MTPFTDIDVFAKGNANNGKSRTFCPFSAFITPSPVIAFIYEEATVCTNEKTINAINEAGIGATIAEQNPPSCFLFHVLLFP